MKVICYGYASPACFKHLGCCGPKVKSEQFLDQLTVCEESYTYWQGFTDDLPVHLGFIQASFTHLPIGIFYIFETQYGLSEVLNGQGRILHSS